MSFFILSVAGALLLLDLLWVLLAGRLIRRARWKAAAVVVHSLFIVLQVVGLLVVLLSPRPEFPLELPQFGTAAVYVWHLLILPVLAPLLLIGSVVAIAMAAFKALRRTPEARHVHIRQLSQGPAIDRRSFLATAAVLAPPLFSVSITGLALRQLEDFRIRRLTIGITDLPQALDGATIAHVSDMHVGRFTTAQCYGR